MKPHTTLQPKIEQLKRIHTILPRLIRLRDAPAYLGMEKNKFNAEVRPALTEIPLGKQAIAFDRLEIDEWVEDYIERNGRPGRTRGVRLWDAKDHPASPKEAGSGMSTSISTDGEFARALEQITLKRQIDSSPG